MECVDKTVSILMAAASRKTVPPPEFHCDPQDWNQVLDFQVREIQDPQRLLRISAAVQLLVGLRSELLTAAARQVLSRESETPGEAWIMHVLKTSYCMADRQDSLAGGQRLDFDTPCHLRDGIFDILKGTEAAEMRWLDHHQGWPYTDQAQNYLAAHRLRREAAGPILSCPSAVANRFLQ